MNRITQTVIKYEWKTFLRNKFQLLMLTIVLVFGCYAVYNGLTEINAQRETIDAITALEQEEFSNYKATFSTDIQSVEQKQLFDVASRPAFAWYRHGYHAILPPHDYSALALGQRDLFSFYYRLTGTSLHYQLFENELANPVNLKAGNFDLSFVVIYLFPLLIIAFCYGLFSAEKENGTLSLLQIQSISIHKLILIRLGFYFVLITGLILVLTFIGLSSSGSPLDEKNQTPALAWIISVLIYCAFWFSLMFFIISFRKSSSFNAITAAGCWLFFLIVIPALLNVIVTIKYPLNSATLAGLTRRTGLENENDEKESYEVIMEFLAHRPELMGSDSLIKNNIMPKAYAAFTTLKDINSQKEVDHYNAQVTKRNEWTSRFHWMSPAVNAQELLTQIAHTDLNTFLHFQKALIGFHRKITDFYFIRLFWDKPILLSDYSQLPEFDVPDVDDRWTKIWTGIAQSFVLSLFVFLMGFVSMKRSVNK